MSEQPLHGDRASNYRGYNGYGYDETEHYVKRKENNDHREYETTNETLGNVIVIQAGWDQNKVDEEAAHCHMNKLGEAFFDDGEEMTDTHIVEQTAHYYENKIPNQTAVFLKRVREAVPHAVITSQAEYSDDLGDDVSRFLPDVDMAQLDFDGLDTGLELEQ